MAYAYIPRELYHGVPTNSVVTKYFTVPTNEKVIIKEISMTNPTEFQSFVDIYIVPLGESPDVTNITYKGVAVGSNETVNIQSSRVLESGYMIYMIQSVVNGANVTISGVELQIA